MSKYRYKEINFRSEALSLIHVMNKIVTEYVDQGYRLTVRQLYYQLVARALIENTEQSYKRVSTTIDHAKMAGLMDWEAIEDRTRAFIRRSRWESGKDILDGVSRAFHMDMWDNQDSRVFIIVEKEALAGVLESVSFDLDVPLLAARGYPSGTVLHEFAKSDIDDAMTSGQHVVILHLGDHDPSGIDMTRDLEERLSLFSDRSGGSLTLDRIALTMEQIKQQKPPPNPAKTTDSRFSGYEKLYGKKSWELDALKPQFLDDLVRGQVENYIDPDRWESRKSYVDSIKKKLKKIADTFKE